MFLVLIELSEEVQIIIVMISTKRLRENDDLDACNSIIPIWNLLIRNGVKSEFTCKISKMSF